MNNIYDTVRLYESGAQNAARMKRREDPDVLWIRDMSVEEDFDVLVDAGAGWPQWRSHWLDGSGDRLVVEDIGSEHLANIFHQMIRVAGTEQLAKVRYAAFGAVRQEIIRRKLHLSPWLPGGDTFRLVPLQSSDEVTHIFSPQSDT